MDKARHLSRNAQAMKPSTVTRLVTLNRLNPNERRCLPPISAFMLGPIVGGDEGLSALAQSINTKPETLGAILTTVSELHALRFIADRLKIPAALTECTPSARQNSRNTIKSHCDWRKACAERQRLKTDRAARINAAPRRLREQAAEILLEHANKLGQELAIDLAELIAPGVSDHSA